MSPSSSARREEIDKFLAEDYVRMGQAVRRLGIKSE